MSLQTWQWDADEICASKPKEVVGIPGFWRVPSKREFEEAIGNGIKSLPHMDKKLWTSSFASTNTKKELRKAGYRKKASSGAWVYYPTKSLNDSAFLLEDPSYDPAGEFDIFIRCVL
jgi:phage pi2 protein 07